MTALKLTAEPESSPPSDLSFSERLETINQMQEDYDASCVRVTKQIQENALKEAEGRETEDQSNGKEVVDTAPASTMQRDPPIARSEGLEIGVYTNATHHADGLFSTVYKATSQDLPDLVALKVTIPSAMTAPHDSRREIRLLHQAASEHVIRLLDSFRHAGDHLVLVFPFMPLDLEVLLASRANHKPTLLNIRKHLRDLFSALEYIHSVGLIHRDVKPSNLLLRGPNGPAYLADFGIAWSPNDPASEPAERKITDVGTTSYRPPELLFGNEAYDSSLDLWAAGCVVAEASRLSDKTLFDSGDLGSELALIQSIFKSLGTPTLDVWPQAAEFRDWGKMTFYPFPPQPWSQLLPDSPAEAQDLVSKLVRYESGERLTAREALTHPFLDLE
ncbi:MAG: hypothetical protein M1819_005366 [Sarea resinae]|nr:MAG: hypothetical protein M1819_005366 [Sarea resinae]